jgi:hypothetical protein
MGLLMYQTLLLVLTLLLLKDPPKLWYENLNSILKNFC